MAERATRFLEEADELLLVDLVVAEVVYVLESFYEVRRAQVAESIRSIIAFEPVTVIDEAVLFRAIEVYEVNGLDFAEAYLVANAEGSGVEAVASFDRSIDRIPTVRRIEP